MRLYPAPGSGNINVGERLSTRVILTFLNYYSRSERFLLFSSTPRV